MEEGTFNLQSRNSVFLIDGKKYEEIVFNDVSFEYLFNPLKRRSRYYEVIVENDNFTLTKDNYLGTHESGPGNNPG